MPDQPAPIGPAPQGPNGPASAVPKSLHQQVADYTVQQVASLTARITSQDLLILDLRAQLAAAATRIQELESPTLEKPKVSRKPPRQ